MNIDEIIAENKRLKKENEDLIQEIRAANNTIRRAKDINPVERPSFKRVLKLVSDACMTLTRCGQWWVLKLGHKVRSFKKLRELFELLIAQEWCLGEIFPPTQPASNCHSFPPPRLPKRHGSIAPSYHPNDVTFSREICGGRIPPQTFSTS